MRSFLKGFKYAFAGIIHCIKNERNMRIHTVAALYVLMFARFFAFTRTEYAVILLTIGGVMSAEAVNTAVENLADRISENHDKRIKIAKDAAAGAVFILAIFSVLIAIFLFGNTEGFISMYNFYVTHPLNFLVLILITVISIIFIVTAPAKKDKSNSKDEGK